MLNSRHCFLLPLRSAAAVTSAGVLCLSLAACGSDSADSGDSPSFSAAKESIPEANEATPSSDKRTEEKPAQKTTTVVEAPPEKKQQESTLSRGKDNGGSSECSSDNDESAYEKAIAQVEPYPGLDSPWRPFDSNFDPCAALSWITVTLEGATASSPYHILLFHNGEYLGTATAKAYGFSPKVSRVDDSEIAVTYRWPKEGEGNAEASGTTQAGFRWDEDAQKVVMSGDVPPMQ